MCYSNKLIMPAVVLILLSQTLAEEPPVKLSPRINNGYPCDTSIAPYFVAVEVYGGCGGTLITYSWVLTGAHCLVDPDGKRLGNRVLSAYDKPELRQVRYVKELHVHPNFNVTEFQKKTGTDLRGDIGLILVNEAFQETANTRVATLPAPGFSKQCNQVLQPGLGQRYTGENNTIIWPLEQRHLMCANLSLIDIKTCEQNYTAASHFDNMRTICTYGQGIRGSCPGDSGGPLICDNVVIGTVSSGGDCSVRDRPTVYTKVESYLDFIDHLVKFTGISIKHASMNDTQKHSDKTNANQNNKHDDSNGTSVGGKKVSNKSSAQGLIPNWKFILLTLLYLMLLYR